MSRPKKNKRRYAVTENKQEIRKIFKESRSKSDVCRKLGVPINGYGIHLVNDLICELTIDIKHFDYGYKKRLKYQRVKIPCPVCGKEFICCKGSKREKKTCSYGCSNSFFRSGRRNGCYKKEAGITTYRKRAILAFGKKCENCSYDEHPELLQVHHIDSDRTNHKLENLIVLCPTCHWSLTIKVATLSKDRKLKYNADGV